MKRSDILAEQISALEDFKAEFETFIALRDRQRKEGEAAVPYRSLADPPDPDDDPKVKELRATVAELSGPAGQAIDDAGLRLVVREPALVGGRMLDLNPVYGWMNGLNDRLAYIQPPDVIDCCGQAIGKLKVQKAAVFAQERSIAGRLARFIRFPSDVREIAGMKPGSTGGRTVFGIAAVIQGALTAALATAIGTLLLKVLSLD